MTEKTNARVVGILFILATAAAGFSQVLLGSLLDDADYLTGFAADETRIQIGAALDLVTAAAVVAIPIMLFSILKRHDELISVGYLVARVLEAVVIIIGAIGLLALLDVSKDFVASTQTDAGSVETLGSMLLGVRDLTDPLGTQLIFSLTAAILYYSLNRTRLVPRFISIWGLIGVPLMFISGLPGLFGGDPLSTTSVVLAAPLAINEMVLAGWLIIKGYSSTATASSVDLRAGSTMPSDSDNADIPGISGTVRSQR